MRPDNNGHRRRRGGRRHQRHSNESSPSSKPPGKSRKPGFFARLLALFTGKGKKQTKPAKPGVARTDRFERSERPERPTDAQPPRPSRKPELLEVTSPKVYVGNLSFDAVESDLFELFSGVGSVASAEIVSHRETQRSKGFGFVTMNSVDEAKRAVTELHDKEFMGRKLVISGAKTSDVR